jgi:hypothetical protein
MDRVPRRIDAHVLDEEQRGAEGVRRVSRGRKGIRDRYGRAAAGRAPGAGSGYP